MERLLSCGTKELGLGASKGDGVELQEPEPPPVSLIRVSSGTSVPYLQQRPQAHCEEGYRREPCDSLVTDGRSHQHLEMNEAGEWEGTAPQSESRREAPDPAQQGPLKEKGSRKPPPANQKFVSSLQ